MRQLTPEERAELQRGLRSPSAFTVRRCQILLISSDDRLNPRQIAQRFRCSDQCVRDTLHAFETDGLACLHEQSRARHDDQRALDDTARARLQEIVHQSPRTFGYETSLWSLEGLAKVCFKEGLTVELVHPTTISRALQAEGIRWHRAKHWINSPDPQYAVKKNVEIS
ncbi:MAG: transposase [Candidatus Bipolaricaulia bacterium]